MLKLPTDPQYQSSSSWCIANIIIRASVEVGVVGVVAEVVLEVVLVVVGANVAGTTGARSQQCHRGGSIQRCANLSSILNPSESSMLLPRALDLGLCQGLVDLDRTRINAIIDVAWKQDRAALFLIIGQNLNP